LVELGLQLRYPLKLNTESFLDACDRRATAIQNFD
jgi:hypothetical protein